MTAVIGAGFVVTNQEVTTAPFSITTSPSVTSITVSVFQIGVTAVTRTVVSEETNSVTQTVTLVALPKIATMAQTETTTMNQNVTLSKIGTVTQTASSIAPHNGTIGVYWQVANYGIVPVTNGMQPVFLGSHDDLYIPMHIMDWYTLSCGTPYSITGTLYWYNYSTSGPSYYGVGNLEVYANITHLAMMTGTQILSFSSNGTSNVTFTSLFTAC
ncbi:MAG: hypothetical protein ACYC9U_11605 [Nitrososphaerales archaeon]